MGFWHWLNEHRGLKTLISKHIGRDPECDLVLQQTTIGEVHARLELTEKGHVYLLDEGSAFGTCLNRNDQWIRVLKIRLCVADRIRFGEHEIELAKLISVFGKRDDIRLGDEHFIPQRQSVTGFGQRNNATASTRLQRPRRNPLTGKIEQNHTDDG